MGYEISEEISNKQKNQENDHELRLPFWSQCFLGEPRLIIYLHFSSDCRDPGRWKIPNYTLQSPCFSLTSLYSYDCSSLHLIQTNNLVIPQGLCTGTSFPWKWYTSNMSLDTGMKSPELPAFVSLLEQQALLIIFTLLYFVSFLYLSIYNLLKYFIIYFLL